MTQRAKLGNGEIRHIQSFLKGTGGLKGRPRTRVGVDHFSPQADNESCVQTSLAVCLMENQGILSDGEAEVHRLGPETVHEGQKGKGILNESQGITHDWSRSSQPLPSSRFVAEPRERSFK